MDFNSSLFNINIPTEKPETGKLLVSEPFMTDQYFSHSVVALVDYNRDSTSMGIVMNRATNYTLGQLVEGFDESINIPVYCGGPMSPDRLFYIHRLGSIISECQELWPGLWIGGDFDEIKEFVEKEVAKENDVERILRFFIGYSGWEARQLDKEISQHVWAVTDPIAPRWLLSGNDDAMWHRVVRSMGQEYRAWLMHPMNPQAN